MSNVGIGDRRNGGNGGGDGRPVRGEYPAGWADETADAAAAVGDRQAIETGEAARQGRPFRRLRTAVYFCRKRLTISI